MDIVSSILQFALMGSSTGVVSLGKPFVWLTFGIVVATSLAFYSLRSVGLFVLAKKQGIKKYGLAFVPFVWIYIACKLVGKARFFNKPIEKLALIFTIIFAVSEIINLAYDIIVYIPLFEYVVIHGGNIIVGTATKITDLHYYTSIDLMYNVFVAEQIFPFGLSISSINSVLDNKFFIAISSLFDIASIIVMVTVYINLFRKFWPQHYMLAGLLSIFLGLFPIFVFVIRKKSAINYADYMRSRYGAYGNPYGNPYNNPYNNGGYNGGSAQTPFEDFEKKKEEPFKDFEEKNKKDPFDEF